MRAYRFGDPINMVHWKLSAKYDSLIVREALIPSPHSRLVHCALWNGPEERDLILGRMRWVSIWLLERGLPHYAKIGEKGQILEITQPEDLIAFFYLNGDSMTFSVSDYSSSHDNKQRRRRPPSDSTGSIPVGSIPVGSIHAGSIHAGSIHAGSTSLPSRFTWVFHIDAGNDADISHCESERSEERLQPSRI